MKKSNYLFCYSKYMRTFLTGKGFSYVCVGLNERTNTRFWLFEKSESLSDALTEYDEFKRNVE